MRVRGVITLSTVRSPSRSTRLTMLRSSLSMTPWSAPSATSRRISSSLTCSRVPLFMPSRRSSPRVTQIRKNANGVASQVSTRIGSAVAIAKRSGSTSAMRLGNSSPSSIWMKVMPDTLRTTPIGRLYWSTHGMSSASSATPMRSPIDAPSAAPALTCSSVMNTCTVARKFSGCWASPSATLARRLVSARCLSRLLRATIRAISLSAKKPFSSASSTTSEIWISIRDLCRRNQARV